MRQYASLYIRSTYIFSEKELTNSTAHQRTKFLSKNKSLNTATNISQMLLIPPPPPRYQSLMLDMEDNDMGYVRRAYVIICLC